MIGQKGIPATYGGIERHVRSLLRGLAAAAEGEIRYRRTGLFVSLAVIALAMLALILKIRRLHPEKDRDLAIPEYMSPQASGLDLPAAVDGDLTLNPGEIRLIPTSYTFENVPNWNAPPIFSRQGQLARIEIWQNGQRQTYYQLTHVTYPPVSSYPYEGQVRELRALQQWSGDGTKALPATTFTYGDGMHLTQGENGYGGKVLYTYETTPWQAGVKFLATYSQFSGWRLFQVV